MIYDTFNISQRDKRSEFIGPRGIILHSFLQRHQNLYTLAKRVFELPEVSEIKLFDRRIRQQ
jgi:hypothetical protein